MSLQSERLESLMQRMGLSDMAQCVRRSGRASGAEKPVLL